MAAQEKYLLFVTGAAVGIWWQVGWGRAEGRAHCFAQGMQKKGRLWMTLNFCQDGW